MLKCLGDNQKQKWNDTVKNLWKEKQIEFLATYQHIFDNSCLISNSVSDQYQS